MCKRLSRLIYISDLQLEAIFFLCLWYRDVVQFSTTNGENKNWPVQVLHNAGANVYIMYIFFAAALAAAVYYALLAAPVYIYIVFFIPFAAARRLVLSKEPFSRGTTRQIAHERLWLLQLHVNYNFIESIWCIIFCHPRCCCLPMGAERGLADSTHSNYCLSAFLFPTAHFYGFPIFPPTIKALYNMCSNTKRTQWCFFHTRSHTSHKKHNRSWKARCE